MIPSRQEVKLKPGRHNYLLDVKPGIHDMVLVYLNGILQAPEWDYVLEDAQLTMIRPPASRDNLTVLIIPGE